MVIRLPSSQQDTSVVQEDHVASCGTAVFPETQFLAVTAYQNDKVEYESGARPWRCK